MIELRQPLGLQTPALGRLEIGAAHQLQAAHQQQELEIRAHALVLATAVAHEHTLARKNRHYAWLDMHRRQFARVTHGRPLLQHRDHHQCQHELHVSANVHRMQQRLGHMMQQSLAKLLAALGRHEAEALLNDPRQRPRRQDRTRMEASRGTRVKQLERQRARQHRRKQGRHHGACIDR